jgi:hypothetical protein
VGQVKTNNVSLAVAVESSLGVLPGSPTWFLLEPNDIGDFGATITTTPRRPISANRQRRKGTTTDLDSQANFEHDLTRDVFVLFSEAFVFATYGSGTNYGPIGRPTAVSTTAYTVPAGPTLLDGHLVFARGFTNSANNGLKRVTTGATTTSIPILGGGLVTETPPANALLEVAGFRFATSAIDIAISSGIATITRLSGTTDFSAMGIQVGQLIHVGGLLSANQFSAGKGYGRVRTVSATVLTLDKLSSTLAADNGTGDTVDLLFGLFLKNVSTASASFLTRSFTFELALPNLNVEIGPADAYIYPKGNLANEMVLNLQLADKATVEFGFVGTDTPAPTTTRATNASTPVQPLQTGAYNTSSDVLRLRVQKVDETGLTTCFKEVSLTLNNEVAPEKCIGTLGAVFMNNGLFLVDLEGEILFTSVAVASAIRNNETVTMDTLLKNDDGAIGIDLPSLTLGDGALSFPVNESVTMALSGEAFQDSFFGTSIGISLFPTVPA